MKFPRARPDGDAGQPGGFGDPGDPAAPDRMSLGRRPEPASPLVEHRLQGGELLGDDLDDSIQHGSP